MRLFSMRVFLLASYWLVGCSTDSAKQTQTGSATQAPAASARPDSAQITIASRPRAGEIGYLDVFNNYYSLPLENQAVPLPTVIMDAFRDNQATFILTQPIDSLQFVIDQPSGFWEAKTPDQQQTSALNADVNYRRAVKGSDKAIDRHSFIDQKYVDAPEQRHRDIDTVFRYKTDFFKTYAADHHLSPDFLRTWEPAIHYEKLQYKLAVGPLLTQWPKATLIDLTASLGEFNNDAALYLPHYRAAAVNLLRILHYLSYRSTTQVLTQCIETANKQFKGATREYLVGSLLVNARDKDYQITFTPEAYASSLNQYLATVQHPELKAYVQKATAVVRPVNSQDALVDVNEQVVPLKKLLQNGKITYVDFWASWCGPCRAEMPASKRLKAAYAGKGVNFIYISTDANPAAWQRAMNQIGLSATESFLLLQGPESPLARQFNIKTIPRYVLLDDQGQVLRADARRPSDPLIQKELDHLLGQ